MKSQTTLDGERKASVESVQVGGKEIQAVTGEEDVDSVLGWITFYTIGPAYSVPRDWLEEKANEVGLPREMLPSETSPKRAFTRACNRVTRETAGAVPENVEADTSRKDYSTFRIELTDRRGDGVDMDVIGELIYEDGQVYTQAKTGEPEYLDFYQTYAASFKEIFEEMKQSNLGKDIRNSVREFATQHSTSVRMRDGGAVYFVPAHYEELMSAWKEIIGGLNEWKDRGHPAALDTVEVIDSPAKREMVEQKVRQSLTEAVEGIVDEALEELDEDQAAAEVVAGLADELDEAENMAVEHNALLNADISVRQSLESWKNRVSGDKEQLVDRLVQQVDV